MGRAFRVWVAGAAALLFGMTADAGAQYFGRNKVQYDRDEVRVLATEHFDVYHAVEDAAAAQLAARLAERWYARLSAVLDHRLEGRQPLVLYGSHRRFEQTNVYGGLIDESTGGFTESRKRRIVLPFARSLAETDHVLGHEIVHAFQFDIAARHRAPLTVPLWFIEGMAEYLTLGPGDPLTAMWMRDAVLRERLPSIGDLSSPRYFPYRWGAAMWAHLVERFGADLPARALRERRDVARRLRELTGESVDALTERWHRALRETYAHAAREQGEPVRPVVSGRRGGARLNVAASLSPDGERMVFLSERDQFSVDLFLADARSGRILRKLVTTAANADFESLQYLHSAGAWDAAGARFALGTVANGRATVLIIEMDGSRGKRALPVEGVDEVYSPTWSPDGRRIAFSAIKGGLTDLYVVEVEGGAVTRLTADAFADLQPAWSPDGAAIAFSTDRFTSAMGSLSFGAYRIGLFDVEGRRITPVAGLHGANNIDPAWSPDGTHLFFVADPGGTPNVFRLERSTGAVHRVTDAATGVSGVTRLSPAISVASRSGTLAYGVFRDSGYEICRLDDPHASGAAVDGSLVGLPVRTALAASIPPVDPLPALASRLPEAPEPYTPRLSLEGIGSPFFSGGGGPFGGYVAAGGSLLFGDLLGDHQLLTTAYVSSRIDESAFGALYVNRALRWNWGVSLEQSPELRMRTHAVAPDPLRERVVSRQRDRLLWTTRQAGAFAAYPLNRSQRVEVSGALRQIAFERERRTESVSVLSGRVLDHATVPLASEPSVALFDGGVALIEDTAVFGATGPMLGTRYRLQATATSGGLSYRSVLADYRKYLMPVRPYTLALRVVHIGRYGRDAGDFRLRDAYVGSSALVRGYGAGTVVRSDCPSGSADCPALNTLLANRLVAAKLELRVPVWSTLTSSSRVRYGPLPMDAFAFVDAGAGWGGEQRFGPGGADGRVVRSVGGGVRVNVMGLIFEAAAVRPLDLRASRWSFGFNLRPGF